MDEIALGNVTDGLPEDAHRLAHLQNANHVAIKHITMIPQRDSELESIINAIRLGFSEVEIDSRGTEHRACDTGINRQRLAEGSDSL